MGFIVLKEVLDILTSQERWFMSIWNSFDVIGIILLIVLTIRMWVGQTDGYFGALVVVTSAYIWMDLIELYFICSICQWDIPDYQRFGTIFCRISVDTCLFRTNDDAGESCKWSL